MVSRFTLCRGVFCGLFFCLVSLHAGRLYPGGQENTEPKILKLEDPAAPILSVRAPAVVNKNEDVLVRAEVLDYEKVKNAYLLYKKYYDTSYTRTRMEKDKEGVLVGRIPGDIVRSVWIEYYIEAEDEAGGTAEAFGSLLEPKIVKILSVGVQEEKRRPTFYVAGGASALCLVLLLAVSVSRRKERARLLDQLFWARLFTPILGLHGRELQSKLKYLSSLPVRHPVLGEREFPREYLHKKLAMVRKIRLPDLAARFDSCFGRGFTVEVPQVFEPVEKNVRKGQREPGISGRYVM
jgi:hypothetical protein